MTWVLGKPFVQGYALIIADICVTYKHLDSGLETYSDGLLKVHDISSDDGIIVGFSGNVEHAFEIIDGMRIRARALKLQNPGKSLDAEMLVSGWRELVATTGKFQYPDDEENGVHMIIASTTLSRNGSGEGVPFSSAFEIKSPVYRPMSVHPFQWHQIGSGSALEVCKGICDELSNDFRFRLMALEVSPEEHIEQFVPKISALLERELKAKGISTSLTIGISSYGTTKLAHTYRLDDNGGGRPLPLATTYEELLEMTNLSRAQAPLYKA